MFVGSPTTAGTTPTATGRRPALAVAIRRQPAGALIKGLWHAHIGWFFDSEQTNQQRFIPDLLADRAIVRVSKAFPWLAAFSLLLPAADRLPVVRLHWQGAATAFFWASLVRIALLHHVTWSINSICHTIGKRPFNARDKSGNVWWLAIPSMGESWHNLHHADPTAARHGVLKRPARLLRAASSGRSSGCTSPTTSGGRHPNASPASSLRRDGRRLAAARHRSAPHRHQLGRQDARGQRRRHLRQRAAQSRPSAGPLPRCPRRLAGPPVPVHLRRQRRMSGFPPSRKTVALRYDLGRGAPAQPRPATTWRAW